MKILYISYYYPPNNHIAGIRSSKQVASLRQLGYQVKVIASKMQKGNFLINKDYVPHQDDVYLNEIGNQSESIRRSAALQNLKKFLQQNIFTNLILGIFIRLLLLIRNDVTNWHPRQNLAVILNSIKDFKPNLIISTSGPINNHIVASKLKDHFNAVWIAEYRDSWSFNPMSPFRANKYDPLTMLLRIKEKLILNNVNYVFGASKFITLYYSEIFRVKSLLVYAGWLEGNSTHKNPSIIQREGTTLNILHLGSMLHGRRPIKPILDMLKENIQIRERFKFYFIGRDTSYHSELLESYKDMSSSVILHDEITSDQARAEGRNADMLLLIMMDSKNEAHTVTGKIFEYIYLKKPIFCLDGYNSEASQLIKQYKLGHVFINIDEFRKFLLSFSSLENLSVVSESNRASFNSKKILENAMSLILKDKEIK